MHALLKMCIRDSACSALWFPTTRKKFWFLANKKQKMTAKQLKEREERALERQRKAQEKAARKALLWRIFVIAVCVILILALSLPTMGLMFLGGN